MAPACADLPPLSDSRRMRSAHGDEAAALSALTLRSKAYSNLTEPEAAAPSSYLQTCRVTNQCQRSEPQGA